MTSEWLDDHYLGGGLESTESRVYHRHNMETALAEEEVSAGHGWNATRKWVIDKFVALLTT